MKYRSGFVSNSSSSSFIICGVSFESLEDIASAINNFNPEFFKENEENIQSAVEEGCSWSMGDAIRGAFKSSYSVKRISEWDNTHIIGVEADPEGFDVNDAVNGFVSAKELAELKELEGVCGGSITTVGGVEWC